MINNKEILQLRMANQQLSACRFNDPAALTAWLGAIQAQDYNSAKLAIGLRLGITEEEVEKAVITRKIVRTWPMRGTLHLVAAEDVRWMLSLSAPRMMKAIASRFRQFELDEKTLTRCNDILSAALEGGKQLTREEIADHFAKKGISAEGLRLSHILLKASLDRLICFGAKKGSNFTFTLLDEWVPASKIPLRDEYLAEMARRYFNGHGPATLKDLVWWSGMSAADARAALEMAKPELEKLNYDGNEYWLGKNTSSIKEKDALVIPAFDEYIIAYADRSACLDPVHNKKVITPNGIFNASALINGKIRGTWKRTVKKDNVLIQISPFSPLNRTEKKALEKSAEWIAGFYGKPKLDIQM